MGWLNLTFNHTSFMKFTLLITALAAIACVQSAQAAIVSYNLIGNGGAGLLGTNERPSPVAGGYAGGEIGAGITFDTDTNILTINIAWGTANGFTNLSSTVSNAHIHGPVAGSSLADYMNGTAGVPSGFGIFTNVPAVTSPSAGGISVTRTFNATQAAQLAAGQFYVNIHTNNNGGGEIRGNLVPIPEPSAAAMILALGALTIGKRRRQ
jgi:hypothetical protein